MVEATEDKWTAAEKRDRNVKKIRNKSFPFYYDWIEIFGKDRANGENAQTAANISQPTPSTGVSAASESTAYPDYSQTDFYTAPRADSSSATKSKGKGKKHRVDDERDDRFLEAVNLFYEKSDEKLGELTSAMIHDAKKREALYDILCGFDFLNMAAKVRVSKYFTANPNELDMFYTFPQEGKIEMLHTILEDF